MTALFIFVVALAVIAVLAWNFYPPFREKLKGWSTIIEAILGGGIYYFGVATDALQEAQKAGYIPSQWLGYLPYVFFAWMILKRVTTSTPVGKK